VDRDRDRVTIWIVRTRPEKLADVDRVYVEDETVA
jgi:hypothetical protein